MRGRITARAEIVDRANQSLPKVMLPDAVYHHACDERAGAVIGVHHPFREGTTLLGGIVAATVSARGDPIILRGLASREHGQETEFHRLALRAKITASEQERF